MTTANSIPNPLSYDHPAVALLTGQFGPLIPHTDAARLLHKSPATLRDGIARYPDDPQYAILRSARRRVGRHVHYDARLVARLIDAETVA